MFHQQPRNVHLIPNRFSSNPGARYFDKTQLLSPKYSPAVSHRVLKLLLLENNPFNNTSSSLHGFAVLLEPARSALKVKTSWVSLGFPLQPITLSCTWIYITLAMLWQILKLGPDCHCPGLPVGMCKMLDWKMLLEDAGQLQSEGLHVKSKTGILLRWKNQLNGWFFFFFIKIFNLLHGSILAIGYSVHRITYQTF